MSKKVIVKKDDNKSRNSVETTTKTKATITTTESNSDEINSLMEKYDIINSK